MVEVNGYQLVFIMIGVFALSVAFAVWLIRNNYIKASKILKEPLRYYLSVRDEEQRKVIDGLVHAIPSLSIEERMLISQKLFGREISVGLGVGNDGSTFFKYITPLDMNEESQDFNVLFEKHVQEENKKGKLGIG